VDGLAGVPRIGCTSLVSRWTYIAALDETNHRLLLYDFLTEKWSDVAEGGLLGAPFWTSGSSALYFQDQLGSEQAIYRVNIANRQVEKVFSCGEILRSSPSHCIFSGLGLDGSLYVMVERGLNGHLRSRPRLTLRIRRFAPAQRFRSSARKKQKFTAYNVMKCRILFPCCGTKFLICGLRGAMPQNDTSLAALNPLIHIIDF